MYTSKLKTVLVVGSLAGALVWAAPAFGAEPYDSDSESLMNNIPAAGNSEENPHWGSFIKK